MHWADRGALAVIDIVARLAVSASLLALAHGHAGAAVVAAAIVSVLSFARGLLSGYVLERALERVWRRLVDVAGHRSIIDLRARPQQQAIAVLLDSSRQAARFEALVVPKISANGIGLALVSALIAMRFSALLLLAAAGLFALLAVVTVLVQRRLRRA